MSRLFELGSTDVLSLLEPARQVRLDTAVMVGPTFGAAAAFGDAATRFDDIAAITLRPPVVDVPADGLALPFDWGVPPRGTDRVDLAPLTIEVQADPVPDFGGYSLGEVPAKVDGGGELTVSVPGGQRIRALHLSGLKSEDVAFASEQQLADAGRRLIASVRDANGAWAAPVVAVPAVGGRNKVPPTLTGATFSNGVLRLPDLAGPVRLSIVENDSPADFAVHAATVGTVSGWAAPTPVDLTLLGPDGATLWAFPGPMPDTVVQALDVSVAVAAAVEKLRAAGTAIAGSLQLTSRFACKVRFRIGDVAGDLVRALPGTTTVELAGEAVAFPLAAPLPPAAPATVIADVKVVYRGRRLADVSDAMPPAGAQRGVVVRQDRVLRTLPPLALRGERVSRIGLVGYCPEPAALLVALVAADGAGPAVSDGSADAPPPALGIPGTANVDAATSVGVIWVDLPEPVQIDRPAAIEVSAGSGRFHWVGGPDPLVRIIVLDPDPGGRPIVLGGVTLLTVDQPALGAVRAVLPAAAFAGQAPLVASALFCTLEVTDVDLRYPRGS
ncbi:hypothetical protein J7E29_15505 [Streptomyces sp. ISL-90]|nr:hypothetical protein [Streptomyces sp. ISL-90]